MTVGSISSMKGCLFASDPWKITFGPVEVRTSENVGALRSVSIRQSLDRFNRNPLYVRGISNVRIVWEYLERVEGYELKFVRTEYSTLDVPADKKINI